MYDQNLGTRASSLPGPMQLLCLAVMLYAGLAALAAPAIYLSMVAYYAGQLLYLPVLLAIGLPAVAVVLKPREPFVFLRDIIATRSRDALIAILVFLFAVAAFTTLKANIPQVMPFWADGLFADLDDVLHGGQPGPMLHALLPDWAAYGLAYLYGRMWLVQWFGVLLVAAFMPKGAGRTRYFWANGLTTLIVGTVLATLFASVGPIFYSAIHQSERFAELAGLLGEGSVGAHLSETRDYLLLHYEAGTAAVGTGISAMPSMHVALAVLNACFLSTLNRWLGLVAWAFAAIILFGSVYLSWHYAVDGYVSVIVVLAVWWLTGRLFPVRR